MSPAWVCAASGKDSDRTRPPLLPMSCHGPNAHNLASLRGVSSLFWTQLISGVPKKHRNDRKERDGVVAECSYAWHSLVSLSSVPGGWRVGEGPKGFVQPLYGQRPLSPHLSSSSLSHSPSELPGRAQRCCSQTHSGPSLQ